MDRPVRAISRDFDRLITWLMLDGQATRNLTCILKDRIEEMEELLEMGGTPHTLLGKRLKDAGPAFRPSVISLLRYLFESNDLGDELGRYLLTTGRSKDAISRRIGRTTARLLSLLGIEIILLEEGLPLSDQREAIDRLSGIPRSCVITERRPMGDRDEQTITEVVKFPVIYSDAPGDSAPVDVIVPGVISIAGTHVGQV